MTVFEKNKIKFYFSLTVWGGDYVNAMLKVALTSFLSPGNIPALSNLFDVKFIFATTTKDYERISSSDIFNTLKQYVTPVFVDIGQEQYLNERYARMTRGYEMATNLAIEEQAYMVYLVPDAIISDGSIKKLEEYAEQQKDVVLIPGPRVIKEKLLAYVESLNLKPSDVLNVSSRTLVDLGLKIFHKQFLHYAIDGEEFTKWPHLVTWKGPDDGLLLRSFHLHPLMINCGKLSKQHVFNHYDTIDRNFIRDNFFDLNRFWIETDSDNILMYSMAEENEIIEYGFWNKIDEKEKAVVEMSQSNLVNELQKHYFYYAYKLHSKDLNQGWLDLEKRTLSLVFKVIQPSKLYGKKTYIYRLARTVVSQIFSDSIKNQLKQWYWAKRKWITNASS